MTCANCLLLPAHTLCEGIHEAVDQNDGFSYSDNKKWLSTDKGLHSARDGCGNEHLHA